MGRGDKWGGGSKKKTIITLSPNFQDVCVRFERRVRLQGVMQMPWVLLRCRGLEAAVSSVLVPVRVLGADEAKSCPEKP